MSAIEGSAYRVVAVPQSRRPRGRTLEDMLDEVEGLVDELQDQAHRSREDTLPSARWPEQR